MGRLAKYKKIKACDPYSRENGGRQAMTGIWGLDDSGRRKKKRSRTATKLRNTKFKVKRGAGGDVDEFDLPPTGGDDFDLGDLLQVKRQAPAADALADDASHAEEGTGTSKKVPANNDEATEEPRVDSLQEEKHVARILRIDAEKEMTRQASKAASNLQRLAGESRKAHQERIKSGTRQLIRREKMERRNPDKRQRKKDFLTNKKKRKKNAHNQVVEEDVDRVVGVENGFDADTLITGERAVARVAFGEQAERPPTFQQLPRGSRTKPHNQKSPTSSGKMSSAEIVAEQEVMEKMRRKVRAQYALLKAKRKKAGDFHL